MAVPTGKVIAADFRSRQGLERELERRYGNVFAPSRGSSLDVAFDRAAMAVNVGSLAELLDRAVRGEPAALGALVRETTIGETYFFREEEGLARVAEAAERAERAGRPLVVWSAGCASGEEAYSLAIVAHEVLGPEAVVRVIGTDVNAAAIERARTAAYGAWSFRNVSEERKERWFERLGGGHEPELLRPLSEIRKAVHFELLNLAADDGPQNRWPKTCDLILCRNVLVYFAPAAARLVARRFASSLARGGELVVASTDPPLNSTALAQTQPVPPTYMRTDTASRTKTRSGTRPVARAAEGAVPSRTVRARDAGQASRELAGSARPDYVTVTASATAKATVKADVKADVKAVEAGDRPAPLAKAKTASESFDLAASELEAARRLADAGSYEQAKAALDVLVAAHSLWHMPRVLRAFVHLSLRQPNLARRDADAALLLAHDDALAHVVAAMASAECGDGPAARRSARNALGALTTNGADTSALGLLAGSTDDLVRTCRALLRTAAGNSETTGAASVRARGGKS